MKDWDRFKLKSDILSTWVTIIAALFGGWWAYDQYLEKVESDKIARSLEHIVRFNSEPISMSYRNIEEKSGTEAAEVFNKTEEGEDKLANFVTEMVEKNSLRKDINVVLEFYEHMHICACVNLCDKTTLAFFFGKNAYNFAGLFAPYISLQRKALRDETYGHGVTDLAKVYIAGGESSKWNCAIQKPVRESNQNIRSN